MSAQEQRQKVTEDQFQEWLENPVTEQVFRALMNWSRFLEEEVKAEMWAASHLSPEEQCRLALNKGRSRQAQETARLDFETFEQLAEAE